MKKVKEQLGDDVCHDPLFLHAVLGCYTTSRVHGIGKAATLRTFAPIATAHSYSARKFTCHVMHRARALSTENEQ